jgi:SAM-dependent methyltransferase
VTYDADWYGWQAGGSAASAAVVAPLLNRLLHPITVLDVGCGVGTWAAQWPQSVGVDGDYVPRRQLRIPADRFLPRDLTKPLDLGRRFDMALCLEVGEHLRARHAKTLVASLCKHADVVVFSAAVPGQGGCGHVNEQWPSYWAKLFAQHGYHPFDMLREHLWWDQRVEWWYRQNLLVFATGKRGWPIPTGTLDLAQPAMVLPELGKQLRATVCIPWRPTPSRLAAFDRVQRFWKMFGWPVVTADSDTEIFSLAQARNNAVSKAKTDVVVVSDADTLCDPLNILRAVADPVGVWWPFTKYRILLPQYLDYPLAELASVPYVNTWDGDGVAGVGGCIVASTKEWWRLGGQPSEFIGWGWEDVAFTTVVRTLSKARRLKGCVYAFEHNTQAEKYIDAVADSPGWDRDGERNKPLYEPYRHADGRAWVMRDLIRRKVEARRAGVSA